jgi:hypothetical protein
VHGDPEADYIGLLSGTSMSTAHVSGVAALLESCNPGMSGPEKFKAIVESATPYLGSKYVGSGIASAFASLQATGGAGLPPSADFTADLILGAAPLSVIFSDRSTNNAISWHWEFGDGSVSDDRNPTHVYQEPGTYTVTQTVANPYGSDTATKVDYIEAAPEGTQPGSGWLPSTFTLYQNYPNPFNPVTTITFDLPHSSQVRLDVYNMLGQRLAKLVDGYLPPGKYSTLWDSGDAPSGVYLYRIQADNFVDSRKMLLLR